MTNTMREEVGAKSLTLAIDNLIYRRLAQLAADDKNENERRELASQAHDELRTTIAARIYASPSVCQQSQPVLAAEGDVMIADCTWPDNICAERHDVTGKWVLHYLTDAQAVQCNKVLAYNNPASLSPVSSVDDAQIAAMSLHGTPSDAKGGDVLIAVAKAIHSTSIEYEGLKPSYYAEAVLLAKAAIAAISPKPRKAMSEKEAVEIMLKGYASDPNQTLHYKCLRNAYRALSAAGAFTNTNGGDDE